MKFPFSTKIRSRIDHEVRPVKFTAGILLILQSYFLFFLDFGDPVVIAGPFLDLAFLEVGGGIELAVKLEFLLVFFLFAAGIRNLLEATVFYEKYRQQIINEASLSRWFGYMVTAPVIVVVVAILVGIDQPALLTLLLLTTATIVDLGYLAESTLKSSRDKALTYFTIGTVLQFVVFGMLFHAAITGRAFLVSQVSSLIIFGGFFMLFLLFPLIMWFWIQKYKIWQEYVTVELSYTVAGFLSKSSVAALVVVALLLF